MVWIEINKKSNTPIIQQIYVKIRELILLGELQEGERLPSSRELANTLNVSRSVIMEVYDQLIAEGFLKSKQGAGTFVESGTLLEGFPTVEETLSSEKTIYSMNNPEIKKSTLIDFRSGIPSLEQFPRKKWGKIAKEVYEDIDDLLWL